MRIVRWAPAMLLVFVLVLFEISSPQAEVLYALGVPEGNGSTTDILLRTDLANPAIWNPVCPVTGQVAAAPQARRIVFAVKPRTPQNVNDPDGSAFSFIDPEGKSSGPVIKRRDVLPELLGPGTSRRFITDFALAPNAKRIAICVWNPPEVIYLRVLDSETRRLVSISNADRYDECPAWSPDGRRVAFYRTNLRVGHGWGETSERGYALCVWDSTTSKIMEIAPPGFYANVSHRPPAWTPDGKEIVFQTAYDENREVPGIYIVGAEGKNLRRITPEGRGPGTGAVSYSIAPGGRQLVFTWGHKLLMADLSGENQKVLTEIACDYAFWSQSGSHIVFHAAADGWYLANSLGRDTRPIIPPAGYRIHPLFTISHTETP